MSEKKSWGSTVAGWFVVRDENESEETPADEPADATRPPAPPIDVFRQEPPTAPGGNVDFEGVFDAAGIEKEDRERIAKSLALLSSLPADTPFEVRKQIVEASLRAFEVPIERIIETGVEEIQALEAYIRAGAADTAKVSEESENRIRQFEEEIRRIRTVTQERVVEQQSVIRSCNQRKLEVQRILEFFGQDTVARVVRESPRLVDPSGPGPKAEE